MKLQTVHLQSLFQREEMVLLNLMKTISHSYQSLLQWEHPHIHFVELDDPPVAYDCASVANSFNPDEPDPEHICQCKHHLCRTN